MPGETRALVTAAVAPDRAAGSDLAAIGGVVGGPVGTAVCHYRQSRTSRSWQALPQDPAGRVQKRKGRPPPLGWSPGGRDRFVCGVKGRRGGWPVSAS